jgi:hypothetical protein
MFTPSDHTATPAGLRRNARLASIGTGGWFASESMAGFVGIRTLEHVQSDWKRHGANRILAREDGEEALPFPVTMKPL